MDGNLAATSFAFTIAKSRAATQASVDRVKRELERDISLPRRIARRRGNRYRFEN
ncbi:hypothetical protein [Burkholderia sp. GS2Y]|uniref:Uncharacterized protein n=1 Tax=Burkholderia theae TaxID=3143496 RepID=A0ABU9WF58_9BURK